MNCSLKKFKATLNIEEELTEIPDTLSDTGQTCVPEPNYPSFPFNVLELG